MKVHVEQQQERSKNKSMETLMQTHKVKEQIYGDFDANPPNKSNLE